MNERQAERSISCEYCGEKVAETEVVEEDGLFFCSDKCQESYEKEAEAEED